MIENNNKSCACCFVGHRKMKLTQDILSKVKKILESLISEKSVNVFYFGSKSEFDDLCYKVVTDLKEKYPHIKRVYVRAAYKDISDSYKNYLMESFEDTYYPEPIENSGRAVYVEINYEMINKSDYCVVYYDENYEPPKRCNKRNLPYSQPKSGTKLAYDYALKRKKEILNVME